MRRAGADGEEAAAPRGRGLSREVMGSWGEVSAVEPLVWIPGFTALGL